MANEFNWMSYDELGRAGSARWEGEYAETRANLQGRAEASNERLREQAQADSRNTAGLGVDMAMSGLSVMSTLALTAKAKAAMPRGYVGGAAPQTKWPAGLCYFTENWLCPSLDEIRAYDHMVSIYGYNQAGRAIDLSANQYMPRVNFSYVKTNNAHINGDLGIYRQAIEQAFNRGIRFWNPKFKGALGTYPEGVIENNKLR